MFMVIFHNVKVNLLDRDWQFLDIKSDIVKLDGITERAHKESFEEFGTL